MSINLNSQQEKAIKHIEEAYSRGEPGYTLLGEGGTGKTTCIMHFVDKMSRKGIPVLLTAPTNKAVKQLEKSASQYGLKRVVAMTTAKALGLTLLPDSEHKHVRQTTEVKIPENSIMVMDEGSMVSKYSIKSYLVPAVTRMNSFLVVMGDPMQLPPVNELQSKALSMFPSTELTKVERFQYDSGISHLTRHLRASIEEGSRFSFDSADYAGQLEVIKPAKFTQFVTDRFTLDTDVNNNRVLAWTNKKVNRTNALIRKNIYGKDANRFEIGETVVTGAPIFGGDENTLQLSTDEECIVKNVKDSFVVDFYGNRYHTYLLTLEPIHASPDTVWANVIKNESKARLKQTLDEIVSDIKSSGDRRKWFLFHKIKDMFADIRYTYCITVHRSQGSTYENVYVDVPNILKNRKQQERNRLLYVAFSRASQNLYVSKDRYTS